MILYIAGPMSGITDHNFPMFDGVKKALLDRGHTIISPADLSRNAGDYAIGDSISSPEQYARMMRLDIQEILGCEGIVMLPGWRNSRGAKFEFLMCTILGIPIYRFRNELVSNLEPIKDGEYDLLIEVYSNGANSKHDYDASLYVGSLTSEHAKSNLRNASEV